MLNHDMQIGTRMSEELAQKMVNLGLELDIPKASGCIRAAVEYWVSNREKIVNKHKRNQMERKAGIPETD